MFYEIDNCSNRDHQCSLSLIKEQAFDTLIRLQIRAGVFTFYYDMKYEFKSSGFLLENDTDQYNVDQLSSLKRI